MDFSMANLKMEDASVLHTLKQGVQNDYIEGIKGVYEAFDPFAHFFLQYGYGARTHSRGDKHDQDPCDCFAMSGDFLDPYAYTQDQMLSQYEETIKAVRLALPVNARTILKYVCDMAQMEYGTCEDVT